MWPDPAKSLLGCETSDFKTHLMVSRFDLKISLFSTLNLSFNQILPKVNNCCKYKSPRLRRIHYCNVYVSSHWGIWNKLSLNLIPISNHSTKYPGKGSVSCAEDEERDIEDSPVGVPSRKCEFWNIDHLSISHETSYWFIIGYYSNQVCDFKIKAFIESFTNCFCPIVFAPVLVLLVQILK